MTSPPRPPVRDGQNPLLAPSGNWSGAGTDDFTVDTTAQSIYRDAVSDSALNNGRYLRCGSGTLTLTTITCDVIASGATYPTTRPVATASSFATPTRATG